MPQTIAELITNLEDIHKAYTEPVRPATTDFEGGALYGRAILAEDIVEALEEIQMATPSTPTQVWMIADADNTDMIAHRHGWFRTEAEVEAAIERIEKADEERYEDYRATVEKQNDEVMAAHAELLTDYDMLVAMGRSPQMPMPPQLQTLLPKRMWLAHREDLTPVLIREG